MGGDSGENEDKLEYMHKIKMKILCDIDYLRTIYKCDNIKPSKRARAQK